MSNGERVTIPAILPASDAIQPGKIYTPSPAYSAISDLKINQSSKKLLVLDLNGTLISRCGQRGKSGFITRPFLYRFFNYIFKYFEVMVWSSAQEPTVDNICNIFEDRPLRLKWHRAHFSFKHSEFHSSVEGIKNLERIWEELPQYNATNTIAIDDTPIKLSLQPYNLVKISTFDPLETNNDNDSAFLQLIDYLDLVKDEPNAAFYIKNNPFVEDMTSFEGSIEFTSTGQRKRSQASPPPSESSSSSGTASAGVEAKKKKPNKEVTKMKPGQVATSPPPPLPPLPPQKVQKTQKVQKVQKAQKAQASKRQPNEDMEKRELKAYIDSQSERRGEEKIVPAIEIPNFPEIPGLSGPTRELLAAVSANNSGDDYRNLIRETLKVVLDHDLFKRDF